MASPITLIIGNAGQAREYAALRGVEVRAAGAELTEVQALDVAAVAVARRRTGLA
jgi:hypothetical protein